MKRWFPRRSRWPKQVFLHMPLILMPCVSNMASHGIYRVTARRATSLEPEVLALVAESRGIPRLIVERFTPSSSPPRARERRQEVVEVGADRSQEDNVVGLLLAALRVKTMATRPTIERSSITRGVVVVDNSQGIFQLVEPKGKIFVPRRVLLDLETQPLVLGASAIKAWA